MTRILLPSNYSDEMSAALPSFLNTDNLQTIALVIVIGLLVGAFVMFKLVKAVVVKVIGLVIIAGLAFAVWSYRDTLKTCADECGCELFGQEIQLPAAGQEICDQLSVRFS